jgi:pimeloyl-ACP methyl ester carboxylesterase
VRFNGQREEERMSQIDVAVPDAHLIDVFGVPTTVRRSGAGVPVVYIHGAFFPTKWLPFHSHLAASVDLIAPLLPGYAEGTPPAWLHSFDDLVLHYRGLLDILDLHHVHLVGYGLGAWVAAQVAIFYPDRFASLTAISPMGLRVPGAPVLEFLNHEPGKLAARLFNGPPGEHQSLFANPASIPEFAEAYGQNGVTARLIWERRYDTRLDRRLELLPVPLHVITPVDDRIVPPVHSERWAELAPTSTLTRVEGVGHASIVQDPERLARIISTYITESK